MGAIPALAGEPRLAREGGLAGAAALEYDERLVEADHLSAARASRRGISRAEELGSP
jgi:hypothetical protein